jgi:hypothetical protein
VTYSVDKLGNIASPTITTINTVLATKQDKPTIQQISATGNITAWNSIVEIGATPLTANIVLTLPAIAGQIGKSIILKRLDSAPFVVSISPFPGDTIETTTPASLNTQFGSLTLTSISSTKTEQTSHNGTVVGATNVWTGKNVYGSSVAGANLNFTGGTVPTTPVIGDVWNQAGDLALETYMNNQVQIIPTAMKDSVAVTKFQVANTTVQSVLTSWAIPANSISTFRHITLTNTGRYSTTGTPTIQFDLYFGSTLMASTGATTITLVTATNFMWKFETLAILNGAPGTATAFSTGGTIKIWDGAVTGARELAFFTNGSNNIDTTIANTFELRVTWGTASASNTIQSRITNQILS